MRLVFVHGRSQQDINPAQIKTEWIQGLETGCAASGIEMPPGIDIRLPYYGDVLDDHAKLLRAPVEDVIERGGSGGGALSDFQAQLLLAMKNEAGITDAEVKAEIGQTATEMGPQNLEFLQGVARLLSVKFKWLSRAILERYLVDVDAYLNYPNVTYDVNTIVEAELAGSDRAVVVGHSLGSVVAYSVLTRLRNTVSVPLFVTAGSPLGIRAVKQKLRPPALGIPAGVGAWLNAADERDPVALYSRLDATTFVNGIENLSNVKNPHDREHWIGGYLADTRVAKRIVEALTS